MAFTNLTPNNDYYRLPIEDAKGCNEFLKRLLTDERFKYLIEDQGELSVKFKADVEAFHGFMNITINSNLGNIEIPERYHTVFRTVTQVAVIHMLFRL